MNKAVIVGVVAVIVIGGGGYLAMKGGKKTTVTSSAASTQTTTITYSDKGFSPSNITVKAGDLVSVTNNSSSSLQFASDPHPQHTDNKDLNVGVIKKGQSMTFRASKIGTFGFHNHYQAGDTGMITVQ
jgi:plastocyanin